MSLLAQPKHKPRIGKCLTLAIGVVGLWVLGGCGYFSEDKPAPALRESTRQNFEQVAGKDSTAQTMEARTLERIQEKEQSLLLNASLAETMDEKEQQRRVLDLIYEYENFIARHPESELGYVFYGKLLRTLGMNQKANNMFVRANALNPNMAVVKQQIGNFLAEEGLFELALPYFLAAIELEPAEALYHYQLGELLYTYYAIFLASTEQTRDQLDKQILQAFAMASSLAPNQRTYTYRYAEAFYDVQTPDWNTALKIWDGLLHGAEDAREKAIINLHRARVYMLSGQNQKALQIARAIKDQPALENTRNELLAQLQAQ